MSASDRAQDFAIAIALGPVGRFIGGGRRSRDLWYGSRFVSEITRRVVRRFFEEWGQQIDLVVPRKERLDRSFFPEHEGPTISNKVLGFVRGVTVEEVRSGLAAAQVAAQNFLVDQLQNLLVDARYARDGIVIPERVKAEIDAISKGDFVEYYAAYAPVVSGDASALTRAMELLSARKNTRAFGAPISLEGAPKSSLDPGRNSVLDEANPVTARGRALLLARRRLGIEGQERLDGISVARRCAGFTKSAGQEKASTDQPITLPKLPFPPLARVVFAPWLEGAERTSSTRLKKLRDALGQLPNDALCLFSSPCREPGRSEDSPRFDFDPSLFLENGVETLLDALEPKRQVGQLFPARANTANGGSTGTTSNGRADPNVTCATAFLQDHANAVKELLSRVGIPQPYYVLLEADGDGIGALLAEQNDKERREALVNALYKFADKSWGIVAEHEGCAFYAGGDELTAYLPADRALDAASALIVHFQSALARNQMAGKASLSVGLAIAHLKDDLRATRGEARKALGRAKELRRECESKHGWICVRELPRAGTVRVSAGEVLVGDSGTMNGFGVNVSRWQQALARELLSTQTAHDLLNLAERFEQRSDEPPVGLDLARGLILQKPQRSGAARRSGGDNLVKELNQRCTAWKGWGEVRSFANEVLLAERLNRVRSQRHLDKEASQLAGEVR